MLTQKVSASTGWIQTNWLEDILLTKYGPEVYDEWSKLKINASNIKFILIFKILKILYFMTTIYITVQAQ